MAPLAAPMGRIWTCIQVAGGLETKVYSS